VHLSFDLIFCFCPPKGDLRKIARVSRGYGVNFPLLAYQGALNGHRSGYQGRWRHGFTEEGILTGFQLPWTVDGKLDCSLLPFHYFQAHKRSLVRTPSLPNHGGFTRRQEAVATSFLVVGRVNNAPGRSDFYSNFGRPTRPLAGFGAFLSCVKKSSFTLVE